MHKLLSIVLLVFVCIVSFFVIYNISTETSFLKSDLINVNNGHEKTISKHNATTLKQWEEHKKNFKKNFNNSTEEDKHLACFSEHLERVAKHNNSKYSIGVNQFSDICPDDFKNTHHNINLTKYKYDTTTPPPLPPDVKVKKVKESYIRTSSSIMTWSSSNEQ